MSKSFNKGQAALEFMMTYGWAILVILAAIGALSYFGVLNPSRFTPDTCLASSPFSCAGKPVANSSAIAFSLVNGQGYAITLNNSAGTGLNLSSGLTSLGCAEATTYICPQGNVVCQAASAKIESGQGVTVRVNCGAGLANANIAKGDVRFFFTNADSQLADSVLITVTAKPK